MLITNRIRLAKFIHRPNRFQAFVDIDGEEIIVHVPNTGRNKEILVPGYTVVLREENNPIRKTKYDLIAGYKGKKLINIDSQIPNKVVEEALKEGKIKALKNYNKIKREKTFGCSRFDFKLEDEEGNEYYLEVKGVTYEENGITAFPDAPTDRGRKHLLELVEVKESGKGAGVLFLIQMDKVEYFTPFDERDKLFGEALRYAKNRGVDIFAYECEVGENYILLSKSVEVRL
ncbi:DNA/RNA nuclease SfsA [Clostridium sp. SYSU_GA19001]|uniref:DNA/RNA nuclease SfsA n=1 Tax=Clostridium caldaquaticum TaxID=2940653 RepID=UPI0020776DA2|nr:DNA/RNA nuclease SfsA [Clostridium caldaquaticum]MCM8711948.1 DNA/RNA nuclease SfsA [Clostridium caldaquaticum]